MDHQTDGPSPQRRAGTEWIIERLVPRKLIWVRIAKTKVFTLKGAAGYVHRLRRFYPDSIYRFKNITDQEVIPSDLFAV